MNTFRRSAIALWVGAPLLLGLSLYRPFSPSRGRAARMPEVLGEYVLEREILMTPRQFELLGTDDATWRVYRAPDGGRVFVVAVFHEQNWKSVHPPHICLRGSDMVIVEDGEVAVETPAGLVQVGRIVTRENRTGRTYLSLYAYVADEFVSGSYAEFFLHHAPRALLRIAETGFLLRVETWMDEGDPHPAEQRCAGFLRRLLPLGGELLR